MNETTADYAYPDVLWAGTEASLIVAKQGHNLLVGRALASPEMQALAGAEPEEEVPYTFSRQGDIGVVTIRGSLVNRDSFFNRIFGMTSYNEIARSVSYAARDPSIKAILLDIDSGGGAMSGCADCANLIRAVDKKIKPVHTFSSGTMASAAYFLGVAGRDISISQTAIAGSIGVIVTHISMKRAMEQEGIDATVLREGKYKSLATPYETLSDAARAEIQTLMKASYDIFLGFCADCRGMTVEDADKSIGQGRQFLGAQAVSVNLVDRVESFDEVVGRISAQLLDSAARNQQNPAYPSKRFQMATPRQALTMQEIAALASGATDLQASTTPPVAQGATPPATTPEQSATPATAPAAGVVAAPQVAPVAPVVDPAAPQATTATPENHQAAAQPVQGVQPAAESTSVLSFFQNQVMSLTTEVANLRAELATNKTRITELEGNQNQLTSIAARSLSTMRVALGGAAIDATTMPVSTLLAEHAAASAQFASTFKVGGVAAGQAQEAAATTHVQSDPLFQARVAAARVASRSK